MTTPKQPSDERQQTNGVTERVTPSPMSPRPIQRAGDAADNDQAGGGQPGGNAPGGAPTDGSAPENQEQQGEFASESRNAGSSNPGPQRPGDQKQQSGGGNGGDQGRFQEGWSQLPQREPQSNLPQREPQSNLPRPGHTPVGGAQPRSVGLSGGVTNARTTSDLAAKAARKEAAMAKSVGLDGPTRSIARPELAKDMPDLSEIRHPLPPEQHAPPPAYTPPVSAGPPSSPAAPRGLPQAVLGGEPLRATVQVRRIDPWSTLKITLVISIAMFFVWMIAVALLYMVLAGMGVWERLNSTFTDMVSPDSGSVGLIDAGTVFGYAGVIGLINVVLFTALATVGTFIYNQCCDMVGGIQVTLADPD
ncbi:DUF3566 domain-containing protein [Nocardia speluncae]|uniref:DUF3566 domain-containing protein n=1 Tax=Nocardia speluncae TaxID=419477 RepID=A0A846XIX8_9NOCA|nr:DUF3566 domain-containing protein [Nocardia speluncae]NKY36281.1 DUF3566 domain-containing protein [Nocardia speluncae]